MEFHLKLKFKTVMDSKCNYGEIIIMAIITHLIMS